MPESILQPRVKVPESHFLRCLLWQALYVPIAYGDSLSLKSAFITKTIFFFPLRKPLTSAIQEFLIENVIQLACKVFRHVFFFFKLSAARDTHMFAL